MKLLIAVLLQLCFSLPSQIYTEFQALTPRKHY